MIDFQDDEIAVFDFIQTKSYKYQGARVNANQLIAIALRTGEIILRNIFGQQLARFDTGLGSEIIDIASPQTVDHPYFSVMNREGVIKTYNFTIIESSAGYYKFAKEEFGMNRKNESKSEEEISKTKYGMRMQDAGFPLKYTEPL